MKKFLIATFLSITFLGAGGVNQYRKGNLVIENIPDIPPALVAQLNPYLNVRYASFCDWLPGDQGILIRTRLGETSQLYRVAYPKAYREQLTFFNEPVGCGYVCPDLSQPYFLFTKDTAGNELQQIYSFNYESGALSLITDGTSKHSTLLWSRPGDKFAFSSTRRNNKDSDIYITTFPGKNRYKAVLQKEGWWGAVDFSPDGKKVIVEHYVSANESNYYILTIASGTLQQINPVEQTISYDNARWSKKNNGIYLIADQHSDFRQLLSYDLKSDRVDILTKQIPWDIRSFEMSPDGNTIAFVSNEDGMSKLYFLDTGTRAITQAQLPKGLIYGLTYSPDGSQLALTLNTATSTSDVYVLHINKKTFTRWTYSEIGGLDIKTFAEPKLIHYATFDSVNGEPRMIPAYYYRPSKGNPPYPVIILCHGGPEGQYVPYFSALVQFFLKEMGIAVLAPNVRGSSGYGKEFIKLDNGLKREDSVKDIGALLDWINKQPELDARRVAISGSSYGGYMVLASMVHYSDRLACGIDAVGISNFVTFLENTGEYRQDLRRVEYGDERDPATREFLLEISPLTNAHKIKRPLLVIQGLNDPRVPVSEAEQIVKKVRKNGVDVWYLLAEDEGHSFAKKTNRDYAALATILFLKTYLLKK